MRRTTAFSTGSQCRALAVVSTGSWSGSPFGLGSRNLGTSSLGDVSSLPTMMRRSNNRGGGGWLPLVTGGYPDHQLHSFSYRFQSTDSNRNNNKEAAAPPPFNCSICGKKLKTGDALYAHVKKRHTAIATTAGESSSSASAPPPDLNPFFRPRLYEMTARTRKVDCIPVEFIDEVLEGKRADSGSGGKHPTNWDNPLSTKADRLREERAVRNQQRRVAEKLGLYPGIREGKITKLLVLLLYAEDVHCSGLLDQLLLKKAGGEGDRNNNEDLAVLVLGTGTDYVHRSVYSFCSTAAFSLQHILLSAAEAVEYRRKHNNNNVEGKGGGGGGGDKQQQQHRPLHVLVATDGIEEASQIHYPVLQFLEHHAACSSSSPPRLFLETFPHPVWDYSLPLAPRGGGSGNDGDTTTKVTIDQLVAETLRRRFLDYASRTPR